MQEDRNLFNQDFKAEPAWSINSGRGESWPGPFPDFTSRMTLANYFKEASEFKISRDTFVMWCLNPSESAHISIDEFD